MVRACLLAALLLTAVARRATRHGGMKLVLARRAAVFSIRADRDEVCDVFSKVAGPPSSNATILVSVVSHAKNVIGQLRSLHIPLEQKLLTHGGRGSAGTPFANEFSFAYFTNSLNGTEEYTLADAIGASGKDFAFQDQDRVGEYGTAAIRYLDIIRFVSGGCVGTIFPQLRFMFLIDDDTVVSPARLQHFIGDQNWSSGKEAIIAGRHATWATIQPSLFGGNGILFSKGAMALMHDSQAHRDSHDDLESISGRWYYEDKLFAWLQSETMSSIVRPTLSAFGGCAGSSDQDEFAPAMNVLSSTGDALSCWSEMVSLHKVKLREVEAHQGGLDRIYEFFTK